MEQQQEQQPEVVPQPVQQAEPVEEIEITEGDVLPENPPPEQPKPFDPKTDKVEFNTPEQQEKFNYVYKQVKMSDARNAMLTNMLSEQQRQLDELRGRFQQTDEADAEKVLLQNIKAARDAGDDAKEIEATQKLIDFKVDKKVNVPKAQPSAPVVSPQDQQAFGYIANMVEERGQDGQLVRPWLNETHPEFNNTIETLKGIAQKYVGDPQAVPKSLAELDNLMRAKMTQKPPAQTRAPNPMQGGNLTNVNPKPTIKMTRQELEIAKKLGVDPKKYAERRDLINKGKK